MPTMRDIKSRINSTEKTSQITKAMHMVSASKLKKAEKSINNFKPLMKRLRHLIDDLLSTTETTHPMISGHEVKTTLYILISSDRGLAGPYNSSVFKAFSKHIEENHKDKTDFSVAPIGRKAMSFVKRNKYDVFTKDSIHIRDDLRFIDFKDVNEHFIKDYLSGKIDRITVFYNEFINTLNQEVKHAQLLPITNGFVDDDAVEEKEGVRLIYTYEPSPTEIINHVLPLYVENTLYGMMLSAKASEHASRMTAMKNATDNAKDIIETLNLKYNRARQAAITRELTDIIGGANAVN